MQLIGMSHCAPEATLKPTRFEFTPKTVITDVFAAQLYWEAVPKTWPGGSKASVAKCVGVHGTAHDLSVDERSGRLGPSETKCMSSARYRLQSTEVPGRTKTSKRNMPA